VPCRCQVLPPRRCLFRVHPLSPTPCRPFSTCLVRGDARGL
jgi:hypothetical protein